MLKLKRFSEGIWVDYPNGGRFKVRPVTPKAYLDIRQETKVGKIIILHNNGKEEIVDDFNDAKFSWRLFDYILQDFEDIEIEGTKDKAEIKEAIFNIVGLRDWIFDRANENFLLEQVKLDDELKNSESSQRG